ncbi:hypothetical protein FORC14_4482 [Vibrio parahaemolyticus]|nr:hypothetical protein FORC14_4482 [Vibrio parahaemolyticus]
MIDNREKFAPNSHLLVTNWGTIEYHSVTEKIYYELELK